MADDGRVHSSLYTVHHGGTSARLATHRRHLFPSSDGNNSSVQRLWLTMVGGLVEVASYLLFVVYAILRQRILQWSKVE